MNRGRDALDTGRRRDGEAAFIVRHIKFGKIAEAVESLCIAACYDLPDDVLAAIETAARRESNPPAAKILKQLVENAGLAKEQRIPLCQDTGLAVVFAEQGTDVAIEPPADQKDATLIDAINAGVARGYEKGFLRKSVVGDPLNTRKNTGSNTPAVIHLQIVPGDKLKLMVLAKGGGCENKSQFKMFKPTARKEEIIAWVVEVVRAAGADACPPFVVGVGIGGDFELSCLLSKKALLRNLGEANSDEFYSGVENDLLSQINSLGLGPQGLGGDTTALAVMIEMAPCHIASLPVAVNIECHSHRHKSVIL
ncbi:MAG: fumarate hydratase [Sedimentisphaerales bacterium]|nr:fumarate hydratase [Sedimentisphaerales bacterium]